VKKINLALSQDEDPLSFVCRLCDSDMFEHFDLDFRLVELRTSTESSELNAVSSELNVSLFQCPSIREDIRIGLRNRNPARHQLQLQPQSRSSSSSILSKMSRVFLLPSLDFHRRVLSENPGIIHYINSPRFRLALSFGLCAASLARVCRVCS